MALNVPKPRVNVFGDTFSNLDKPIGNKLDQKTLRGDIDASALNRNNIVDDIVFNRFESVINSFILARLGYPVVRVELTPFQIKTCIDEATTKLYHHAPEWSKQYAVFTASAGINIYEIPTHILNNLTYVVYKKTLLAIQNVPGTLEFDFFIKYFQDTFLFSDFAVGDYQLLQIHLEQIRKVLGQEGTFSIINNQYLQIYPTPANDQAVILEYKALDSGTMHPAYLNWIQKYALACAKMLLGEIRGKYSHLPSPAGGASLNGDRLIQDGMKEKDKLEEDLIFELEDPPAFTTF